MASVDPYQTPSADVASSPEFEDYDQTSPFSPKGRFGRLSYLAWSMAIGLLVGITVGIIGGGIEAATGGSGIGSGIMILGQIGIFVVVVMFGIRRLHDFDASGWWYVAAIVPIANVVLALFLLFKPGTEGGNRFGPPRETRGWEKVVGYIAIGLIVLGIIGIVAAVLIPMMAGPQ